MDTLDRLAIELSPSGKRIYFPAYNNICERIKMDSSEKVLVVSADASQRSYLRKTLEAFGFDVGEAPHSESVLIRLQMVDYDAVLLDCLVFEMGDVTICNRIRALYPRIPILILSACECLDNKVAAFEAGVDDYMNRSFPVRELTARLRSAIRRFHAPAAPTGERFAVGEIVLDSAERRVERSGTEILLTPIEFRTLQMLMRQAGKPVSHSALLATIWGEESRPNRERLRVVISCLRKKLEKNPSQPTYLTTHSYFGYCFRDQRCR